MEITPGRVPQKFRRYFVARRVAVPGKTQWTTLGPRETYATRWVCRECGQAIRANTLGAQAHLSSHVRHVGKA